MEELKGKRVLFIGPNFFGYELEIKKEIENFGAKVDFFDEKPHSLLYRIVKQISEKLQKRLEKQYLNAILSRVTDFDIFFLIRGEIITVEFIKDLKEKNSNARFIMYQWDSAKNNPNYVKLLPFFDKISTFDMVDAEELQIDYLPLFYTSKYKDLELDSNKIFDIVFFGSFHGDRLEVIKLVDKECMRLGLIFKHHLFISKLALVKRLFFFKLRFSDLKYLTTKSVSSDEILETYKVSKAVLDIENQGQNGLTMRTFEVLGCGLKLITTNKKIVHENCYSKNDIMLTDRKVIKLNKSFLQPINNQKIINNWNFFIKNFIRNLFR